MGGVVRERLPELLDDPLRGRVRRDVEVKGLPAVVQDDEQDVEDAEGRRETTRTVKKSIAAMTSLWL